MGLPGTWLFLSDYAIFFLATTEQLRNRLIKLRSRETRINTKSQIQQFIPSGRDQIRYRVVDIFDGLSDADIASFN